MRTLTKVEEFKREAGSALFTKQQAVAITMRLLELEQHDPQNSEEETALFTDAIAKVQFRYLDATETETDAMLDSFGVARFTVQDIVGAIEGILFDVQ